MVGHQQGDVRLFQFSSAGHNISQVRLAGCYVNFRQGALHQDSATSAAPQRACLSAEHVSLVLEAGQHYWQGSCLPELRTALGLEMSTGTLRLPENGFPQC